MEENVMNNESANTVENPQTAGQLTAAALTALMDGQGLTLIEAVEHFTHALRKDTRHPESDSLHCFASIQYGLGSDSVRFREWGDGDDRREYLTLPDSLDDEARVAKLGEFIVWKVWGDEGTYPVEFLPKITKVAALRSQAPNHRL